MKFPKYVKKVRRFTSAPMAAITNAAKNTAVAAVRRRRLRAIALRYASFKTASCWLGRMGTATVITPASSLEHGEFRLERLLVTSPRRGESKPERQRRLRVRGLSVHSDSRIDASPAPHLTMRVDLSPAGRGELIRKPSSCEDCRRT